MKNSGKFVLRVPPSVHTALKEEAIERGLSLNQIINLKIQNDLYDQLQIIKNHFQEKLLGIIIFGSSVRGESKKTSDIDLLIVLENFLAITRSLYSIWDQKIEPQLGSKYSPQFTHLPEDMHSITNLWLEVALEGEIAFDTNNRIRKTVYKIKDLISSGEYIRKKTHGHPYWIRKKNV